MPRSFIWKFGHRGRSNISNAKLNKIVTLAHLDIHLFQPKIANGYPSIHDIRLVIF